MEDFQNDFSNVQQERQLLRYVSTKDFSIAPAISPDIFAGTPERKIFNILLKCQSHFSARALPDIILRHVKGESELEVIDEALDRMLAAPSLASYSAAREVLKSLQEIHAQRVLYGTGSLMQSAANAGEIEQGFKAMRMALASDTSKTEFGEYIEDYTLRKTKIDERLKKQKKTQDIIPTGIMYFDQVAGGLKKGEVGVVAAETGAGKSLAKLNFAAAAWLLGFNVLHIGLEMSREENEFRMDTLLTQIPGQAFRLADLSKADIAHWKNTIDVLKKERNNYIMFVGGRNMTMPEILAFAEGVEGRRGRLDLLVLDHILLVKRDYPRDLHMKLWENFQELSEWAKDRLIAVWTSSQITDDAIKKSRSGGMKANAIKYGRAVAELAQVVLTLWQTEQGAMVDEINMYIAKGRNIKRPPPYVLRSDYERMVLDLISFCNFGMDRFKNMRNAGKKKRKTGRMK